ncbi:hypothetical protein BDN67DRAFT_1011356 [Paxillus ammoniavirescens]|nr:hypothetical protein BDN67DRAFT_1011356 [Paxillus ammoniavirescens]
MRATRPVVATQPGAWIQLLSLQAAPSPRKFCEAPDVERYFAIAIAALNVMDGISTLVSCGVVCYFASRYGRKSALLLELATGVMGCSLTIGLQLKPNWLGAWLRFPGFGSKHSPTSLCTGTSSTYIVDVSTAENRGSCSEYDHRLDHFRIVYIFLFPVTYVTFVLPESFPKGRGDGLRRLERERRDNGSATTTRGSGSTSAFLVVLEPLKSLEPRRKSDGARNWRLVWCAVHILVIAIANIYVVPAWFVIITTNYYFTPGQTGFPSQSSTLAP